MKRLFEQVGTAVHRAWAEVGFDEARLPGVATSVLRELGAHQQFDLDAICDWFFSDDFLPSQHAVPFASPPLVAWQEQRFFLEVPFWADGTTVIHDHGFSGAFQVLAGSSIHTWYEFEPEYRAKASLILGNLKQKGIEYLRPGDVRPVDAGRNFIHALFHIERPSITLLARTYADPDTADAFEYLPPNVRVRSVSQGRLSNRREQMLTTLATVCSEATDFQGSSYGRAVARIADSQDLSEAFYGLRHLFTNVHLLKHISQQEALDSAVALATKRHGARITEIVPALQEEARQLDFTRRRSDLTDVRHRVVLGALLNGVGRNQILDILKQRFGGDPQSLLRTSAEELIQVKDDGVHLLDMHVAAPARSAPAVRTLLTATFSALLDSTASAAGVPAVLERVRGECPSESERYGRLVEDLITGLRNSWSFRTLFATH